MLAPPPEERGEPGGRLERSGEDALGTARGGEKNVRPGEGRPFAEGGGARAALPSCLIAVAKGEFSRLSPQGWGASAMSEEKKLRASRSYFPAPVLGGRRPGANASPGLVRSLKGVLAIPAS
jgi:hypothetical protein